MNNYIFKTTTTIKAKTLKEALLEYQKEVYENSYIEISKNALKTKQDMFVDTSDGTKQVGYVITGKSDFEDRDNYRWSTQYIDLWVTILTVVDTEF